MNTKKKTIEAKGTAAGPFLNKLTGGPLTFGRMLWTIRECDEISQTDMAEKLGISRANLCDIEKDRKYVSPERAARWAKILGYSELYFVQLSLEDQIRKAGLKLGISVSPLKRTSKAA